MKRKEESKITEFNRHKIEEFSKKVLKFSFDNPKSILQLGIENRNIELIKITLDNFPILVSLLFEKKYRDYIYINIEKSEPYDGKDDIFTSHEDKYRDFNVLEELKNINFKIDKTPQFFLTNQTLDQTDVLYLIVYQLIECKELNNTIITDMDKFYKFIEDYKNEDILKNYKWPKVNLALGNITFKKYSKLIFCGLIKYEFEKVWKFLENNKQDILDYRISEIIDELSDNPELVGELLMKIFDNLDKNGFNESRFERSILNKIAEKPFTVSNENKNYIKDSSIKYVVMDIVKKLELTKAEIRILYGKIRYYSGSVKREILYHCLENDMNFPRNGYHDLSNVITDKSSISEEMRYLYVGFNIQECLACISEDIYQRFMVDFAGNQVLHEFLSHEEKGKLEIMDENLVKILKLEKELTVIPDPTLGIMAQMHLRKTLEFLHVDFDTALTYNFEINIEI